MVLENVRMAAMVVVSRWGRARHGDRRYGGMTKEEQLNVVGVGESGSEVLFFDFGVRERVELRSLTFFWTTLVRRFRRRFRSARNRRAEVPSQQVRVWEPRPILRSLWLIQIPLIADG